MIKLTFLSLHHYLSNKVSDNEMKVFQRAWSRLNIRGQKDLWYLISVLKRDREVQGNIPLYQSILSYWDEFKDVVEHCLQTSLSYLVVRFK